MGEFNRKNYMHLNQILKIKRPSKTSNGSKKVIFYFLANKIKFFPKKNLSPILSRKKDIGIIYLS